MIRPDKLLFVCGIGLALLLIACDNPGKIRVENGVSGAVLKNVRWGSIFLSEELLPGERSSQIRVFDNIHSGVDLPAEHPVVFYLEVNGDLVFLETREQFPLDINTTLDIVIADSTPVFNSLVDD